MNLKFLKGILTLLQWILLAFSLVAILIALIEGFKMDFSFTSTGFQNYLSLYQPYSLLFGATFVVLTTNLAIERLGLLTESSRATYKIGNRAAWIETANYFIEEVKDSDPYMIKVFKRNILNIHDFLFDHNYKFSNKQELQDFFNQFVKDQVIFFEQQNETHVGTGGVYRDEEYTYSFQSFKYIFANIVKLEESYQSTMDDLQQLFVTEVKKLPNRQVDKETFRMAIQNYQMERFNRKREDKSS
ncbi:MAG: hypothetical protein RLN90_07320 [Balneolaceae bacterium]